MRKIGITALVICILFSVGSCAMKQKKAIEELKQPVNCATAEADLRVLRQEKAHVAERIAEGAMVIVPIGLVIGIVAGTEGTKVEVATGKYNQMIDEKIAEIKATCGVE